MIEARGSTTIERPAAEVFAYLADARNEPSWLPGAERVELVTPEPVGLGTRFEGTYARAGTVSVELVEFEPPRRVTFRARSRIVDFDDAVELTEEGGRTLLHARMTARPRGPMRLAGPLMARTMRRQFEANWAHLKAALESRGP
jgi:carbon monoxide dehydrogenase subunit G